MSSEYPSESIEARLANLNDKVVALNECLLETQTDIAGLSNIPTPETAIRLGFGHILLALEMNKINLEKMKLEDAPFANIQFTQEAIAGYDEIIAQAGGGIYIPAQVKLKNIALQHEILTHEHQGYSVWHNSLAAGYARISMGMPISNGLVRFHAGMLLK